MNKNQKKPNVQTVVHSCAWCQQTIPEDSKTKTRFPSKALTVEDHELLWGEGGPYSQANLTREVRILDRNVTRSFLLVTADINPFTFRFIKKHKKQFFGDSTICAILNQSEYRGVVGGYCACLFSTPETGPLDEKEAKEALEETQKALIRMHDFVISHCGIEKPS